MCDKWSAWVGPFMSMHEWSGRTKYDDISGPAGPFIYVVINGPSGPYVRLVTLVQLL